MNSTHINSLDQKSFYDICKLQHSTLLASWSAKVFFSYVTFTYPLIVAIHCRDQMSYEQMFHDYRPFSAAVFESIKITIALKKLIFFNGF